MTVLTETHKKIIQDIVEHFINNSEMPNRKVFRAEHAKHFNDINSLERAQVLQTDGDKLKISLKFFRNSSTWQKEKRITNKILKTLRLLYKNDQLAEFPIEQIVPKDEIALHPSGIKRALYYLREVGLTAGARQDSNGNYTAISPHENVLLYDDIDAKIDAPDNASHPGRTITEDMPVERPSDKEKTWRVCGKAKEG